ncbi:MAG: DNA primase [Candidatus Omnitrophica bacterium]|nr:DNA primase [Candidatus Omnitrophota bacterium]
MPFFSPDFLERLQSEADIVHVISSYIPLKPSGSNFKALCPFHNEKTPSFTVSPEKQIYHCFGCSAGGGVIGFVRDFERVDFPEAVRILANKTGMPLPEVKDNKKQQVSRYKVLYDINEAAADYYHHQLISVDGRKVCEYLDKRGLPEAIVTDFKLGYAPQGWEGLLTNLKKKGFKADDIERAGLILPRRKGDGYYDRFRQRLMFPIFDIRSRVVGFGGRSLSQADEQGAKYLNSPQTEIFDKGRLLYGLDKAKSEVSQKSEVIIVEGYMDFLACFQAGICNSAATLGTALTPAHLKTLSRYCQTIVMIYDSDKAGQAAALRGLDLVLEHDLAVRLVSLPTGYDPDSFLTEYGWQALVKKIEDAQNLFDYKISLLKQKYNFTKVEDRAIAAADMLPTIAKINNQVLKSGYIRKLAEELGVSEGSVLAELNKLATGRKTSDYKLEKPERSERVEPLPGLNVLEENIISLMLDDPDLVIEVKKNIIAADFKDKRAGLIVSKIFELSAAGIKPSCSKLIAAVDDKKIEQLISGIMLARMPVDDVSAKKKELRDCLARFSKRRAETKLESIKKAIKEAEDTNDQNQLNKLLTEYQKLSRSVKKSCT